MFDPRQKEHLALAREAGTKAMAKDFFAPTPGAGGPLEGDGEAAAEGEAPAVEGAEQQLEQLTPEQLEELLTLLAQQQDAPAGE